MAAVLAVSIVPLTLLAAAVLNLGPAWTQQFATISIVVAVVLAVVSAWAVARLGTREIADITAYFGELSSAVREAPPTPALRVRDLQPIVNAGRNLAAAMLARSEELELLLRLDRSLAAATSANDVVRIATTRAREILQFDAATAFLLDRRTDTLILLHAEGLPDGIVRDLERHPAGSTLAGRTIAARAPVSMSIDFYRTVGAQHLSDAFADAGFRTLVGAPFIAHGEVYGALTLMSRTGRELRPEQLGFFTSIGTQAAMALTHAASTEQRIAQERLSALGRLAAGVAHELRNPLAVVKGRIELLRIAHARGAVEAETLRRHLTAMEEAGERMAHIVAGLSTYSKPPREETTLLDVAELVPAVSELVQYAAKRAGVEIKLQADGPLPARIDRSEMMQVLLNLATNAIEAMEQSGGELIFRAQRTGDQIVVAVVDTGPGIPADRLARIWEPFYTTKPEGTGLGLSLVRGLVEKWGDARIDLESRPAEGTTFRILLPAEIE